MRTDITEKQKDVLNYIRAYRKEKGIPPSIREIADHLKREIKTAYDHVLVLEKKNYLRRIPNTARGIILIDNHNEEIADAKS